jgi:hypothetical protein
MGGFGSGLYHRGNPRPYVSDYLAIDVRPWERQGLLKSGKPFITTWRQHGRLIGIHVFTPSVASVLVHRTGEILELAQTPCNYGGARHWLVCPGCKCRRAKLHDVGGRFQCRKCAGLVYQTQCVDEMTRLRIKADRLNARIGGSGVYPGEGVGKPRGMHWKTYHRLQAAAQLARSDALGERIAQLNKLMSKS